MLNSREWIKGKALWVKINRHKNMHTAQTLTLEEPGISCFPLLPVKDFKKFIGNWDQNLQQTEGTNSMCILEIVVLFCLPFDPVSLYFPLFSLAHIHNPTSQPSLVIRSIWSITQHLSNKYVSRAWCNSTHQRGMFEKHMQLPSKRTVVMNICKETYYLLNSE